MIVPSGTAEPAGGETAVLRVEELRRDYVMAGETVHALRDVSLVVGRGEYVAIMGPSGSGKSTLMNILGCLDTPSGGRYWLHGTLVSGMSDADLAHVRNRDIGFVFQTFNLLARATALRNVELPLVYSGVPAGARRQRAMAALERVQLADRVQHRPNELSGGQRQRVAIARALVTEPALLLADEPTGNLDSRTGEELMSLLQELHSQGHTLVVVTHDSDVAAHAHRRIVLRDGAIASDERASRAGDDRGRRGSAPGSGLVAGPPSHPGEIRT
jgi:putative ABC transport system ATP-binding protein